MDLAKQVAVSRFAHSLSMMVSLSSVSSIVVIFQTTEVGIDTSACALQKQNPTSTDGDTVLQFPLF